MFKHKHSWRYNESERIQFRHSRYTYLIQMYVCNCGEVKFEGIDMKWYDSMVSVSLGCDENGPVKTTTYPDGWTRVEHG